jgi:predicted short-subunit dehydrogenase-like oxidoreductase (DUF2520 family)
VLRVRIVGPGRAGRSLAGALATHGAEVAAPLGRADDLTDAADGVDLLVVATPDAAIADVARQVRPVASTVMAHLAGSLGLDVLEPHPRRAGLHPMVSMPNPEIGAERLVGSWFGVAGDPLVGEVVALLDGRSYTVADEVRPMYHAAGCVAANHLVALMGQVERLAAQAGVPFEVYVELAARAMDNVAALGPAAALTGPAARGDEATVRRHLDALPAAERPAYQALADLARAMGAQGRKTQDGEPEGPHGSEERA